MAVDPLRDVHGGFVDLDGDRFYRIAQFHHLPPFLVPVVGAHDVWLFLSSSGGLTAGRRRPDSALFPYVTEDKLADTAGATGSVTVVHTTGRDGRPVRWEPLAPAGRADPRVSRALFKDVTGSTVVVEEVREDLGLRFREVWRTGGAFGVVRESRLAALDAAAHRAVLVDGLQNLLPAGVTVRAQAEFSVLIDAYKRAELHGGSGLATYWMGSRLTDRAEPSEALLATACWRLGAPGATVLLDPGLLHAFRLTGTVGAPQAQTRGRRGAYLLHRELVLEPGAEERWQIVADVEQDAAAVVALVERLRAPGELARAVAADLDAGRQDLLDLLGDADARQATGQELTGAHHVANVLFNAMRGGTFRSGYTVGGDDVRAFVAQRSPRTARRCARELAGLPVTLPASELHALGAGTDDADLARLLTEYLPLSWGRRHGDPSRPWNTFEIAPPEAGGVPRPDFQGNWRDIFQNWEALAFSYPEYLEAMVATFLSATTADGYNPYRISRGGVDWERPEPDEPWSNIGYWSDHQIVYLLALLRASQRFHPGRLTALLARPVFTHADVPYRIRGYRQILADPRLTIDYDTARAELIDRRTAAEGADGRLLAGASGELVRVTGLEKLLLLLLAKLVNLVPGAGIWMNTQRPEWNDANNALVGTGISVVTLAQLRAYLVALPGLLTPDVADPDGTGSAGTAGGFRLSEEVADLLGAVTSALASIGGETRASIGGETRASIGDEEASDRERRRVMDLLGTAGSEHRARVYAGPGGRHVVVPAGRVQQLVSTARAVVEAALRANRRPDGLYHSYNRLSLDDGRAGVHRLPLMLEGQVALLSSGLLDPAEALGLLRAVRASALYRPDRNTYQLYPDRELPGFVARNRLDAATAATCPLVGLLAAHGDRSIVVRDVHGDHHFAGGMHNADDVRRALARLAEQPPGAPGGELREAVRRDGDRLLELYEQVFRHADFTGRSGSFFGYEGLGSIYWHMVAKLQVAALESYRRAVAEGAPEDVVRGLAEAYLDVRSGLGNTSTPADFGAFPADPHSHTPAGSGARQPGMTGQVKESILARFGELGLQVRGGRIRFVAPLLEPAEWTTAATVLRYREPSGRWCTLPVPAGALAFTFCQVPVLYRRGRGPGGGEPGDGTGAGPVVVHRADGLRTGAADGVLDAALSASIFGREGLVTRIEVTVPGD